MTQTNLHLDAENPVDACIEHGVEQALSLVPMTVAGPVAEEDMRFTVVSLRMEVEALKLKLKVIQAVINNE